ncbi:MAG: hypothetical protein LBV47_02945 [Bacteroidales bacterium]|nr:hypothetical protein [Bacteroidales bacterium]
MKTIYKLMILSMLILYGCAGGEEETFREARGDYMVFLAVTDTSGNDLTKGIGIEVAMYDPNSSYINGEYWITGNEEDYTEGRINPELFTLDILIDGVNPRKPEPAPLVNGRPAYVLDEQPPPSIRLYNGSFFKKVFRNDLSPSVIINPDYNYLMFRTAISIYKMPEKIVFRLTCPYLFGDNEAHDIITWLEPYKWENGETGYLAVCYRMEFEGKELTVDGQHCEPLTIILDR